ncbi:MAG TPA: sugar ABC transporter permease [Firmicutes bacterium]|nr:sugar ABC transporter permease [Bacillota bacterium]
MSFLTKSLKARGYNLNEVKWAYIFLFGAVALVTVFVILPMIATFVLAWFRYDGIRSPVYVGLDNFQRVLKDSHTWRGLWLTLYYMAGTLPVTLIIAFTIAVILDEKWFRGKQLALATFVTPYVLPFVGAGFIWVWLMNPMMGVLNYVVESLGGPMLYWFRDTATAMPSIWITANWKFVGWFLILYVAALANVPVQLYEAAKIDGVSNKLQEIWYITLPLTRPTTFFLTIMGMIGAFSAFDIVYITTQGGPNNSTRLLVNYIYELAFVRNRFGDGSAAAFFLFLVMLAVTALIWQYYTRRIED